MDSRPETLSVAVALTRNQGSMPLPCVPATGPRFDAALPFTGSGPPLLQYYHDAMTSCRRFRRSSLPSRGGTTRCVREFVPLGARRATQRPGVFGFGVPLADEARGHDRISQVPGEPLSPPCACASTPVGLHVPHPHGTAARPPPLTRTTAPTLELSKLHHMALRLAVYASCSGSTPLPRKTRFQVLVRLSWVGVPPTGFR